MDKPANMLDGVIGLGLLVLFLMIGLSIIIVLDGLWYEFRKYVRKVRYRHERQKQKRKAEMHDRQMKSYVDVATAHNRYERMHNDLCNDYPESREASSGQLASVTDCRRCGRYHLNGSAFCTSRVQSSR